MKDDSCDAENISMAVFGETVECRRPCEECFKREMSRLADAIEEEQKRAKTEHDGATDINLTNDLNEVDVNEVDVDALLKLADRFDSYTQHGKRSGYASMTFSTIAEWAYTIRDAVKGANPSISTGFPEGVERPRFEDAELEGGLLKASGAGGWEYRFPEVAGKPPLPEQALKVAEEALEVQRAALDQDFQAAAVEAMDVIHAAETLLRRLEAGYGIDPDDVRDDVVAKNRERGYYGEEAE